MGFSPKFSVSKLFLFLMLFLFQQAAFSEMKGLKKPTAESIASNSNMKMEVNLKGTIEVRAALYQKNKGEAIQYILKCENQHYYLKIIGEVSPKLQTGTEVLLKKAYHSLNNEIVVNSHDIEITKVISLAIPESFGPQKTITMLVNFQDQPNNKPWTTNDVSNMVYNNVNRMYYEVSYNQTTVVGTAVGWFTLPINSNTDCNTLTNNMPALAEKAAQQNGIDLSQYTHRVYIFPNTGSCGWAGLGTIGRGGAYSNAWINGYNDLRVISHELGHNIGLYHSNGWKCDSNGGNCQHVEYGDYSDTMGWGFGTHFNAFQKDRLGWLNYGVSPPITNVTNTGNYNISPYETNTKDPKALKILKGTKADGSSDYYYLEFRQPIGFDAPLGSCGSGCDFTQGILIHTGNSANPNSSYIIDPTPATSNPQLVALKPGTTYTDAAAPNGGLTITTNSISSSGANVTVKFGATPPPPNCTRAASVMSITPSTIQQVRSGQLVGYTVSLTNQDSAGCTPNQYSLFTPTTSGNLRVVLNTSNLTLNPGQTATINTWAWTNAGTPVGNYFFAVIAYNAALNNYSAVSGGLQVTG